MDVLKGFMIHMEDGTCSDYDFVEDLKTALSMIKHVKEVYPILGVEKDNAICDPQFKERLFQITKNEKNDLKEKIKL